MLGHLQEAVAGPQGQLSGQVLHKPLTLWTSWTRIVTRGVMRAGSSPVSRGLGTGAEASAAFRVNR